MSKTLEERQLTAREHIEAAEAAEAAADLEGAIAAYSMAIHFDPAAPRTRFARGRLRAKLGRLEEAIDDLNHAIRLDPSYVRAFARRGLCYLQTRDYEGAENDFTKALSAAPDHTVLLTKRAQARLLLGRGWEALDDANKAIAADSEAADGYYWRGMALEAVNDAEGAEQNLRDAYRRGSEAARDALVRRYGGA